MADFDLAKGLMQLAGGLEQRKARKEQKEFEKRYKAPYMEALTGLYNAQATKMADKELTEIQKEQSRKTGFEADRLKLVLDEIANLDPNSPLRAQAILGIRDTQDMANELRMMGLRLQEESLNLRRSQAMVSLSTKRLGNVFADSAEGAAIRKQLKDAGKLTDVVDDAIEGAFDIEMPTKIDEEGFFDKLYNKIEGLFESKPSAPSKEFRGAPAGMTYPYTPKPKPKPAPSKPAGAQKKAPEATQLSLEESAAILTKAQANEINPLDIATGVEKLKESFPDLDRATLLEAHNLLAEGIPVEEIEEYIKESSEK